MRGKTKTIIGILAVGVGILFAAPSLPPTSNVDDSAQEKNVNPKPEITLSKTPADAIAMAQVDLQMVPLFLGPLIRYVWIPDASKDAMRVVSLTCNFVSRASVIQKPLPVAGGHLIRIDLRQYWPREIDLQEVIKLWEEFSYDPTFSRLITKDQIDFATKLAEVVPQAVSATAVTVVTEPAHTKRIEFNHAGGVYTFPDDSGRVSPDMPAGRYYVDLEFKAKTRTELRPGTAKQPLEVDVIRVNSPALPGLTALQFRTASLAPLVDWRYFVVRALSTVRDKGVFRQVWGGLYYQLRGIRKAKEVLGADTKATDLDLFFEQLGIGNIKAGITSERLFDTLRSDQRLAIFRSGVAGKPREVSMFTTPAEREGAGWGAITGDVKDADVDVGDRSFANLLNPRRQAREAIFPTRNGFLEYALFNGDGALQDEVPPDVAVDSTIPAPYTRRLQAAIGCIRCHGPEDLWKPLVNDVKKLMAGNRLDIFGDLGAGRNAFTTDTVDRLAGLYAGDFSNHLRRARDDSAEAMLRASGPWSNSRSQADAAARGAAAISKAYGEYFYDLVTPKTALRELGFDVSSGIAQGVLDKLLKPDLRANNGVGGVQEDVRLRALAEGIPILRIDWALAFTPAFERTQNARNNLMRSNAK